MSMIDSLLPMSNNKYYEYGSPPQQQHTSFLLSPSSSSSIIKNSNNNSNYSILQAIIPGEEISTIFVVGFPDNMQEREFQNMFMFSPGFEAATLKVPNTTTATTTTTTHTMSSSLDDENNRKQIIGFAKFRTRLEALDAKEILNGKKIDQEKGCILKAEMAKKNLHTKKEIQQQQQQQPILLMNNNNNKSPYEAFHSVPINNTNNESIPSTSPPCIMPTTTKSTSYTHNSSSSSSSLLGMMGNNNNKKVIVPPNNNVYPTSSLSSQSSLASSSVDYPFLLHKLYNNKKTPKSPTSASYQYNQQLLVSSSASTPILSKDQDYLNRQHMVNMMDQNPPCNTLYVGNLPINTNEEELRMIFSNCIGYKRLSFRTKSNNGPMCFVEFEDIPYATLALKELNGNPLSNSVKGGIRLSYSKNPLGVRQNIVPSLH